MKRLLPLLLLLSLVACQHPASPPDHQQRPYTLGANMELYEDSIILACLPLKDCYDTLRRGDRIVVAEFAVHTADGPDSLWVKVAHTQEVQGWLPETALIRAFVPDDSISQSIYVFSKTPLVLFLLIFALMVTICLLASILNKQVPVVYFNDIDSLYPQLLCLLTAAAATLYETMQVFTPAIWEHYYFNPTLSPLHVPGILGAFLAALWLILIVSLAALDDIRRQLSAFYATCYLLSLAAACIFCYLFFILTTHIYIGYPCLLLLFIHFLRRLYRSLTTPHYACGNCGQRLKQKGECPNCGAINE